MKIKIGKYKDVGSIALFDWAQALDLNDNGQVLLKSRKDLKELWAVGYRGSKAIMLPELPVRPNVNISWIYAQDIIWQRVNGSDLVLGTRCIINSRSLECTQELITWKLTEGINQYAFSICKIPFEAHPKIAQCGNSKHIVITFEDKIYLFKTNHVVDLTPILLNELQKNGYNYYKVKWNGIAVNNNGTIYGKLDCFQKHPFKDTPTFVCANYFLFDGNTMNLIDVPDDFNISLGESIKHLNNNDEVLFRSGMQSWVWNIATGFRELTYYNDEHYLGQAIAVLDDNTVIFAFPNGGGGTLNDILFNKGQENSLLRFYGTVCSKNIDFSNYPG
ncbi:MAG TPA: hypothetical protein VIH61_06095, partial [Waddliaceae bacterium]